MLHVMWIYASHKNLFQKFETSRRHWSNRSPGMNGFKEGSELWPQWYSQRSLDVFDAIGRLMSKGHFISCALSTISTKCNLLTCCHQNATLQTGSSQGLSLTPSGRWHLKTSRLLWWYLFNQSIFQKIFEGELFVVLACRVSRCHLDT